MMQFHHVKNGDLEKIINFKKIMKKLILLLLFIPLISCTSDEEETRIFTVTVKAMPPEGGTVTLGVTQETTGEYEWGNNAFIIAKPADGYLFENFSGSSIGGAGGAYTSYGASESIEMRCNDVTSCNYDITITGHFVKEN